MIRKTIPNKIGHTMSDYCTLLQAIVLSWTQCFQCEEGEVLKASGSFKKAVPEWLHTGSEELPQKGLNIRFLYQL